jgi:ATP-binding cassette subfamily B protein
LENNSGGILWCVQCLGRYAGQYGGLVVLILSAVLIEACFNGALPMSFKYLIDEAVAGKDHRSLLWVLSALGGGVVLASLSGLARTHFCAKVVSGVMSDLQAKMFAQLQALSMNYYARTRPGETIARFSSDLAAVESALTSAMPFAIMPGVDICVSTVLIFWLDWRLACVAMLVWPMSLLGPRLVVPSALRASSAKLESESQTLQWVQENVAAQPVVKAFGLESKMTSIFQERNLTLRARVNRLNFLSGLAEQSSVIGILILQVLILAAGAYMTYRGWLTVGALGAFQALFLTLASSVSYVSQYAPTLIRASGALKHIHELLAEEAKVADAPKAKELAPFQKDIVFQEVSFSYTGEQLNLNRVNVAIAQGNSVAFVGGSGSGKSTMTNLVMRFYDPNTGKTLVDGQDLKEVTQASWRRQIGTVLQENFLFNTTVRENIRFGNPFATDEQIIEAAKAAEIHEIILRLPQGYETPVGERGGRLSGGQRQRIAIARALVANPAVLILDEATSALDPATEAQVNRTLAEAGRGRTVLSVTHRLASVKNFDQICVFDKGCLVEQGRHEELLARRGFYHGLWEKQSGFSMSENGDKVTIDSARLGRLPFLDKLAPHLQARVASAFVTEHYSEGCTVLSEGDRADRFYVMVRGKVEVTKITPSSEEKRMAVLNDGDYFGEMALLNDLPRTATVRTVTPCVFVSLSREHFLELLKNAPNLREQIAETAGSRAHQMEKDLHCRMQGDTSRRPARKILIAEDQPVMRALLRRLCVDTGDEVIEHGNGLEALAAYQTHRPDWVIMDLMMPGMDGLSALVKMKSTDPEARVVIVTQEADNSFRNAALEAGAIAFFTKDNLLQIRQHLRRAEQ